MAHRTLTGREGGGLHPDSLDMLAAGDAACGIDWSVLKGRGVNTFDDTDEEAGYFRDVMPGQYAGGTLKCTLGIVFESEVTATDEAVFDVSVEAITAGDATDLDNVWSFDSVNTGEVDPLGTAGYETELTITLTNKDSVAAGDRVLFHIRRDCDHGNDTATDDCYITTVEIWEDT